MNLKFQIFIPNERKPLPISIILLATMIGLGLMSYALNYFSIVIVSTKIIAIIMFVIFFLFFVRAAIVRGKVRPYHGTLKGWIHFSEKGLKVNDEEINIDRLKKLDFQFGSYYSEFIHHHTPVIEPWSENGTNNFLKLIYIDGTERSIQFQRMYETQQEYLKPFLEYVYLEGKISFLRLINILGYTAYDQIQEYKKIIKG